MAGAVAALVIVSFLPWSGGAAGDDSGVAFNAWANRRWSEGVALTVVAGVMLLAYRSRNAVGAAGLAVAMLVGALGIDAWQWHQARKAVVTEISLLTTLTDGASEPSPEEMRRQFDEAVAAGLGIRHRTRIWPAFYAGMGATAVILAAAARALGAGRRRSSGA